jgi:glycosyltransferase involved in cell wall biosynthesis
MASHIRRIPAVLTWHNDLPPVTKLAGVLIRAHDSAILPKYIRVYRRVIATSSIYVERSQILSRLGQLVTVIPNGVDCRRFNLHVEAAELRTRLSLDEEFTLLFVGALTKWHRYKGLDVLLEATKAALERRRGLRLLVLGDGELRSEYQRIAARLGLSENVCFLGDISDAELPQYYAASDALVLPSKDHSEGFGLTILEACASGKPVIASNVGGIPSIVTHDYNGLLVQPNDPSSLAEATLYLSKNRVAAIAMGRNGRKLAEAHDWKRTAALTEQAYVNAIAP